MIVRHVLQANREKRVEIGLDLSLKHYSGRTAGFDAWITSYHCRGTPTVRMGIWGPKEIDIATRSIGYSHRWLVYLGFLSDDNLGPSRGIINHCKADDEARYLGLELCEQRCPPEAFLDRVCEVFPEYAPLIEMLYLTPPEIRHASSTDCVR